ncbi:MAG: preprotein translocase subunit SecE [Patescibacteria group bacterium]
MSATNYLKETKAELRQVSWPTRRQAINYTLVVIGLGVVTALLLSLSDIVFSYLLGLAL